MINKEENEEEHNTNKFIWEEHKQSKHMSESSIHPLKGLTEAKINWTEPNSQSSTRNPPNILHKQSNPQKNIHQNIFKAESKQQKDEQIPRENQTQNETQRKFQIANDFQFNFTLWLVAK